MARYLTVDEINTQIDALGTNPDFTGLVTIINLPNVTDGGRTVRCIRINHATAGVTPVPVLVVGGLHAREWTSPEALLDLAQKILAAYHGNTPVTDARFVMSNPDPDTADGAYVGNIVFDATMPTLFSAPDVQRVVNNVELFLIPCVNPDGRAYTLSPGNIPSMVESPASPAPVNKKWWRKNRRNMGTCTNGSPAIGVDINRNFSGFPGWDADTYYDTVSRSNPNVSVSTTMDSASYLTDEFVMSYHGTTTLEAETQNIVRIVADHNIKFYLDCHSFQREIYYPWGLNEDQMTDPAKSQYNDNWDNNAANTVATQKGRPLNSGLPTPTYQEYFPTKPYYDLHQQHIQVANAMKNLIFSAAGSDTHAQNRSNYAVKPSFSLYSSPGDSCDYVFSTQLERDPTATAAGHPARIKSNFPVFSFTIEAGHESDGQFWPSKVATKNQFLKVRREVEFSVIALIKFAASWSPPVAPSPPPPSGTTSRSSGCFSTIIWLITLATAMGYGCYLFFTYFIKS